MKDLYGLKTAPRDYQEEVAKRQRSLGLVWLVMCSCSYVLRKAGKVIDVYDYVDDFIFTGSSRSDIIDEVTSSLSQLC